MEGVAAFQDSSCDTHITQGRPCPILKKPSFLLQGRRTLVGLWTWSPAWGAALMQTSALVPCGCGRAQSQHLHEEVTAPVPLGARHPGHVSSPLLIERHGDSKSGGAE